MEEKEIAGVAAVLAQWNPLGDAAKKVPDLDGYRTEAIDIIFALQLHGRSAKPEQIVMDVLNQAFDLSLKPADCIKPTEKILALLGKKHEV